MKNKYLILAIVAIATQSFQAHAIEPGSFHDTFAEPVQTNITNALKEKPSNSIIASLHNSIGLTASEHALVSKAISTNADKKAAAQGIHEILKNKKDYTADAVNTALTKDINKVSTLDKIKASVKTQIGKVSNYFAGKELPKVEPKKESTPSTSSNFFDTQDDLAALAEQGGLQSAAPRTSQAPAALEAQNAGKKAEANVKKLQTAYEKAEKNLQSLLELKNSTPGAYSLAHHKMPDGTIRTFNSIDDLNKSIELATAARDGSYTRLDNAKTQSDQSKLTSQQPSIVSQRVAEIERGSNRSPARPAAQQTTGWQPL